jgi:hypothetical protein
MELERRARTLPRDEFFAEIERRVAAKPKRAAPKSSRKGRGPRPLAITPEDRRVLRGLLAELAADPELRDELAARVRERATKPRARC